MNTECLQMVYRRDTNANSVEKRMRNVLSFAGLDRTNLIFSQKERRLLLHETNCGEKIYIQYPGKETVSKSPDKIRPWDFRPKLLLPSGEFLKDLSFPNIWDDLADMHDADGEVLSILASLFFRMAFMEGFIERTESCSFYDFEVTSGRQYNQGMISFSWYKPNLPMDIIRDIQHIIGPIRGASLEAYLIYNDLLVQNEDCKYYYRDVEIRHDDWNSKVGRHNTLLSHISVIEYLQGRITFSEIMSRFQRGMGVAPVTVGRMPDITNNLITRA